MKNKIKKGIFIGLGSILMLGLSGCIKEKEKLSLEEQVLQYMEEKYGEEFEFIMGDTQSWRDSHREAYVSSDRFPGEKIKIEKDSRGMRDSYVNLRMEEELEQAMSKTVSSVFSENKIFLTQKMALLPYESEPEMTLEEYMQIDFLGVDFTIVIPKDPISKEQDLLELSNIFQEKGYGINFTLIYLEKDTFDIVGKTDYDHSIETYEEAILAKGGFSINKNMELDFIYWY